MSQIKIPNTPNVDPGRVVSPGDLQALVGQLSNYALPGNTDVAGNQDPATGFYGAVGSSGTEGNFIQYTGPRIRDLDDQPGLYSNIDQALKMAQGMNWQRNGKNPNIIASYQVSGFEWPTDELPWAATFVTWVLAVANINGLRNMSSQSYSIFGDEVDWRTWTKVRKNDIVILKSRSKPGGHVGFIQTYNPRNATFELLGGNQSNRVKISRFEVDDGDLYVKTIRRNWSIPSSKDKPLFDINGKFPESGLV